MINTKIPETESAKFNMALMYYLELHNLRIEKIRASITNDVRLYYDCLEEIFTMIYFKIIKSNKDDAERLEAEFTRLRAILNSNTENNKYAASALSLMIPQIKVDLRKMDRDIMILMDLYDMLMPRIEVTGLEQLQKRFGLLGEAKE